MQWNFSPEVGVNAPAAWDRMNVLGRPGGLGVKVAVLDTGVAYASRRGFKRSPDLLNRFVKGFDFVDNDAYPDDLNGHGTHVASTIAETSGNAYGVTGLAYGTRLMPVRVLDRAGTGDSVAISGGIRYAARKGAKIINLSFEFDSSVTRGQIPDILDALRYARRKGALVVGASGNFSAHAVAYPARATQRALGRRDDGAPLPGRLLELRATASTSPAPAAGSTPRSRATRTAAPARSRRAATSTRSPTRAGPCAPSGCRAATSAPRWRRRTCRRPPRSWSPRA